MRCSYAHLVPDYVGQVLALYIHTSFWNAVHAANVSCRDHTLAAPAKCKLVHVSLFLSGVCRCKLQMLSHLRCKAACIEHGRQQDSPANVACVGAAWLTAHIGSQHCGGETIHFRWRKDLLS